MISKQIILSFDNFGMDGNAPFQISLLHILDTYDLKK